MERIKVVNGLSLPFFPMRPVKGTSVRTKAAADKLYEEVMGRRLWILHPKLNGDRVSLAVVNDKVYVQNRLGDWYTKPVLNAWAFRELGNGTCLDGEVHARKFYAFDLLALNGKSFVRASAGERDAMAQKSVELIHQPWAFKQPTRAWLEKLGRNLPQWEGVVLKRTLSPYIPLGTVTQQSAAWVKHLF